MWLLAFLAGVALGAVTRPVGPVVTVLQPGPPSQLKPLARLS